MFRIVVAQFWETICNDENARHGKTMPGIPFPMVYGTKERFSKVPNRFPLVKGTFGAVLF